MLCLFFDLTSFWTSSWLHCTHKETTTWQLYLWPSNWPVFNMEMGCSISRPWLVLGGRNARGKIMCFSFGQIFSILQPPSSNSFYQFRPSFCFLFVLWLDRFLDIFLITLHTQRNNTTWQLYLWPSNWPVFNTEIGCSTSRPWPLHVQRRSLRAAVFLTAPVLSPIVPQPSELFFTK